MKMRNLVIPVLSLLLCVAGGSAHASLSFTPANTFSGTAAAGFLTAAFTDVTGGVRLVITSDLASGENLDPGKAIYFNFNPLKYSILTNLSFSLTGNTNFSEAASVSKAVDDFKADGDGFYDIRFSYSPSTKAFSTGQSQTYFISTGSGTVAASDFTTYLSEPGGGNGNWLAAAHVQGTPSGGGGSAWVGATLTPVPVPAALPLFGSGLALLGVLRRRVA